MDSTAKSSVLELECIRDPSSARCFSSLYQKLCLAQGWIFSETLEARQIDGRPFTQVDVDGAMLDVEASFCYLGDMLGAGGGCELAIITRCCTAWGKFKKLLPLLTSKHVTLKTRGKIFNTCIRSALLHGSETWAPAAPDLQRLRRNDRAMIRWFCGVKPDDEIPIESLLDRLGIQEVTEAVRTRRLRWFGHVTRATSCINDTLSLSVPCVRGRGRPKKTWSECVRSDRRSWNLDRTDPHNRTEWRLGVKNAGRLLPTPVPGTPAADDK
ncbi:hypothetical protein EGW08_013731 [Elysia chlorotica]|uniref:Reverse transcriptase domain-containing protein n=1 Tax=Elysia chlorotica TaxID=188477 RepID=A0A3S1B2S6_ELYCH|nr:hypothetical protein EGW08_013731 [Elysia chlorotica]